MSARADVTQTAGATDASVRDVSCLLSALEGIPPGSLIPARELAEQIRSLPAIPTSEEESSLPERLLTAAQVADWLQLNVQSVYRLGREGHLARVRLSDNTVRFRQADVERCLDRRTG